MRHENSNIKFSYNSSAILELPKNKFPENEDLVSDNCQNACIYIYIPFGRLDVLIKHRFHSKQSILTMIVALQIQTPKSKYGDMTNKTTYRWKHFGSVQSNINTVFIIKRMLNCALLTTSLRIKRTLIWHSSGSGIMYLIEIKGYLIAIIVTKYNGMSHYHGSDRDR